jgi:hypothetical protein
MSLPDIELSEDRTELLAVGVALGQNQSFGLVAGRCSAAQAASLARMRAEKHYLQCAPNWRTFCTTYLKISGAEADRIIRNWEDFGAEYFELSQMIRISPERYRAIEPAVKDGALHHNGEAIEFDAANRRRLAIAVSELRAAKPPKKPSRERTPGQRIAEVNRLRARIIADLEELFRLDLRGETMSQLRDALCELLNEGYRLEKENCL